MLTLEANLTPRKLFKTTQSTYLPSILPVPDVPPRVDYIDLISVFPVQQVLEPLCWWKKKYLEPMALKGPTSALTNISKNLENCKKAQFFLQPLRIRAPVAGSRSACRVITSLLVTTTFIYTDLSLGDKRQNPSPSLSVCVCVAGGGHARTKT